MILLDYRKNEEGAIYCFITDIKEINICIDWLKKQKEKMEKRGQVANSIFDFMNDDRDKDKSK